MNSNSKNVCYLHIICEVGFFFSFFHFERLFSLVNRNHANVALSLKLAFHVRGLGEILRPVLGFYLCSFREFINM